MLRQSVKKWILRSFAAALIFLIGAMVTIFSKELNDILRQHTGSLDILHWSFLAAIIVELAVIIYSLYISILNHEKIIELNNRNKDLISQLETDTKSGLSSYDFFVRKFEDEYIPAAKSGSKFSVLMVDLVDFKKINNNFGHDIGDEVISLVGGFLKSFIRGKHDLAARYGEAADEFFFIISGDTSALTGFANRLRRELKQECSENFELLKSRNISLKFWSSGTLVAEDDTWTTTQKRLSTGLISAREIRTESTIIILDDSEKN